MNVPTCTSGGHITRCAVHEGSTDHIGAVDVDYDGPGNLALYLTFGTEWADAPGCVVWTSGGPLRVRETSTTTGLTARFIGSETWVSVRWKYICAQDTPAPPAPTLSSRWPLSDARIFAVNHDGAPVLEVTSDRMLMNGEQVATVADVNRAVLNHRWFDVGLGVLAILFLVQATSKTVKKLRLRAWLARQPEETDWPYRNAPPPTANEVDIVTADGVVQYFADVVKKDQNK